MELTSAHEVARLHPDGVKNEATPAIDEGLVQEGSAAREVYVFRTSYAQRSLWILHQLAPESAFYNVNSAIRIKSPLNTTALERSLNELIRRHKSFRTVFKVVDGEPVQVVAPKSTD